MPKPESDADLRKQQLKDYDRLLTRLEETVASIIDRAFDRMARKFSRTIRAASDPIDYLDLASLAAMWHAEVPEVMAILETVYAQSAGLTMKVFAPGEVTRQELVSQYVLDAEGRLTSLGDELAGKASKVLSDGVLEGKGYDTMRRDLQKAFAQDGVALGKPRAERIARTQVHEAWQRGSYDAAHSMKNPPKYQMWVATLDEATRPDHYTADNQVVELGELFLVGGEHMRYPGDPTASSEQTIQCRCTTILTNSRNPLENAGRQYLSGGDIAKIDRFFEDKGYFRRAASGGPMETKSRNLLGQYRCSCQCHSLPGVSHVVACCDKPPIDFETRRRLPTDLLAAAKESFSGAIVALIPTEEDAQRLALPDYEPPESLHITLSWLGDTESEPAPVAPMEDVVAAIKEAVGSFIGPIETNVFAYAEFNPNSDDKEPACVLLCQSEDLASVRQYVQEAAQDQSDYPVWFPHLTLGYNVSDDIEQLAYERMGTVTFDRVRVSYGSDNFVDIVLGESSPPEMEDEMATKLADEKVPVPIPDFDTPEEDLPEPGTPLIDVIPTARIRAATLVDIPAFPEARIALTGEVDEQGMAKWTGPLALVGVPTGDSRQFTELNWYDPPLPLRWVREDDGYHMGAVIVGRIDSVTAQGEQVIGEGVIDTTIPEGAEVAGLMEKQLAGGISVDVDSIPMVWRSRLSKVRLSLQQIARMFSPKIAQLVVQDTPTDVLASSNFELGLDTLVLPKDKDSYTTTCEALKEPAPAEVGDEEAYMAWLVHEVTGVWPATENEMAGRTANFAVVGNTDLPIADREVEWDGPGAASRVLEWADGDAEKLSQAFLYRDDDADPATEGAYKLGFADVVDGELMMIPRGVFATTGSRGVDAADIPDETKNDIKTKVCGMYAALAAKFDDPSIVCPFDDDGSADEDLEASAWSALRKSPAFPAEWFEEPENLPQDKGAIHVDGGRIFGWVARRGVKHEVLGVNPPLENVDLSTFLRHEMPLSDGSTVPVGAFTMNAGHHRDGAECETSSCQFDDTRTVAGIVTVGVNQGGMWFSGAAAPWLSDWDMAVFRACQPSGHWRWEGRAWSLRAVLSVPVPGYPSPLKAAAVLEHEREHIQAHTVIGRSNLAIVAAAMEVPEEQEPDMVAQVADEIERRQRVKERDAYAAKVRRTKAELLREQVLGRK